MRVGRGGDAVLLALGEPIGAACKWCNDLPEGLGDKWNDGVGQPKNGLKDAQQCAARGTLHIFSIAVEGNLGEFHIPIAEVIPYKFVDLFGGEVEAVLFEVLMDACFDTLESRDDPAVGGTEIEWAIRPAVACADSQAAVFVFGIH